MNVFDGAVSKCFHEKSGTGGNEFHRGFVADKPSDWDNYHLLPLLLYLRASNPYYSPINQSGGYVIASKRQVVDGSECLVLEPDKRNKLLFEFVYYVDPEQGFAIKRFEKRGPDRVLWSTDCKYANQQGRRFLSSWKTTTFGPENSTIREQHIAKVTRCDFQIADPNAFSYEFPDDTIVTDRTGSHTKNPLVYVMQNKEKRVLTREERRNGIKFEKQGKDTGPEQVVEPVDPTSFSGIWLATIAGALSLIIGTMICIKILKG